MMYKIRHIIKKVIRTNHLFNYIYYICWKLCKQYYIIYTQQKWRKLNQHNYTCAGNKLDDPIFPISKVVVGNHTYGVLRVYYYSIDKNEQLKIGSFCSIANGVRFLLGGMHYYDILSTYPFKSYFNKQKESFSKGPTIIEDDVWIGADSLIMQGITIGKGTIIAAGSIVTKSTEPYSVVGGNPARLIKKRFDDETINRLLQINFSDLLTYQYIINNIELLYSKLTPNILAKIEKDYNSND